MKVLFVGKGISNNGVVKFAQKLNIKYDYVDIDEEVEDEYCLIVKGPGISYDSKIIKKFINLNKIIITDIEFTYWFLTKYFIGITGSNGKTTTTSLITNILNTKYKAVACGNIGYSIGEAAVNDYDKTHFVCELSSFELKGTNYFKPKIAIITNINCCHLDYHKTFEDYLLSKKKILLNQKEEDVLIYNIDCENTKKICKDSIATKYTYSIKEKADCYIKNGYIYFKEKKFIKVNRIKETNTQTLGNYLASIITSILLEVPKKDIIREITKFKKDEYRFEYVKKNIINDAKSTNVYSTISAINSIKKPVILVCGGLYRNYELEKLDDSLDNIMLVFSYGETKDILHEYFESKNIKCIKSESFYDAVKQSKIYLNKKSVLLFSPMFASYDIFTSYKERGILFNQLIE
ncbi:MAG: UDP-N-acetylmuramoyl-L-alanine--D-glutamate ligase [bacterium]